MDVFAPELREHTEKYQEKREFSASLEKQLIDRDSSGYDNMPDIITCPNKSCRNPLTIKKESNFFDILCSNCGWKKRVYKKSS